MDVRAAVALSLVEGLARSRVGACLRETTAERPDLTPVALLVEIQARLGLLAPAWAAGRAHAAEALAAARRAGLAAIPWGDARYPPLLAEIHDPPPVLWVRGRPEALLATAVAIVGARAASPAALETARHLGESLARRGVAVISGLARGVDSAAHRGALEGGGVTVGVLGSGADRIYPAEHGPLARNIVGRGAVITELVPGTPPLPAHFPLRNRIISGLVRAVVVVEAAERSGSLITARCGLEQGREVMAVPGLALGGRNRGAHALIRDGAKLVESADDILEELAGFVPVPAHSQGIGNRLLGNGLDGVMRPGEPCSLDELSARTGADPGALLGRLLELELDGLVRRADGGRFVRAGGRVVG